jgi:hypothetical protein
MSSYFLHTLLQLARGSASSLKNKKRRALLVDSRTNPFMKNTEQRAATTVLASVASGIEGKGEVYLEDCRVSKNGSQYIGYASWA